MRSEVAARRTYLRLPHKLPTLLPRFIKREVDILGEFHFGNVYSLDIYTNTENLP